MFGRAFGAIAFLLAACAEAQADAPKTLPALDRALADAFAKGHVPGATVALVENGRIVFMFCAFDGPPKIVRLHGRARAVLEGSPLWAALRSSFPDYPGTRSIIVAEIDRVSDSCGYGVPRFELVEERDTMIRLAESFGPEGVADYQRQKNARSIDGLPALDPSLGVSPTVERAPGVSDTP